MFLNIFCPTVSRFARTNTKRSRLVRQRFAENGDRRSHESLIAIRADFAQVKTFYLEPRPGFSRLSPSFLVESPKQT